MLSLPLLVNNPSVNKEEISKSNFSCLSFVSIVDILIKPLALE
nr:MAG TPA: hypothetical protein [Bacteriophage sp.]